MVVVGNFGLGQLHTKCGFGDDSQASKNQVRTTRYCVYHSNVHAVCMDYGSEMELFQRCVLWFVSELVSISGYSHHR